MDLLHPAVHSDRQGTNITYNDHIIGSRTVIEFCGPAVGVAGDSLSGFKSAVIFQKIRDAGRPEGGRRIVSR